uniref:Transmembrane protein 268 n=1 Tax=Xiphophorus maculatus TaxID=8083 RepID=A0A3B5Q0N8_XIPMA
FDLMEDRNGDCQASEETAVDFETRRTQTDQQTNNNRSKWTNGQCIAAIPTSSTLNPRFDLDLCRSKLEQEGFEIPVTDMEDPLKTALDVPSIRRYMVFNSGLFHFVLAPININIDVRLIQVNERMMKHKLMVGVADWIQNCTGHMQLYFVYWDMSYCWRTLCETLEERSFVTNENQKTMKSRMSHLVLVTELPPINPEAGGSDVEQDSDENRPLLRNEDTGCSTPSSQRGDSKVTSNYSLVPETSLPAQAKAYQLLMTYGAVYVKLLMSERLSGPSRHRLRPLRSHCTRAPVCLCQYIKTKVLQ